ncbi:MAG TPA: hypothetical protein VMV33_17150 [Rhodocyclaceae bacterium]|nr:hypothetical protein [Rhodocyclaceae bacterium]
MWFTIGGCEAKEAKPAKVFLLLLLGSKEVGAAHHGEAMPGKFLTAMSSRMKAHDASLCWSAQPG